MERDLGTYRTIWLHGNKRESGYHNAGCAEGVAEVGKDVSTTPFPPILNPPNPPIPNPPNIVPICNKGEVLFFGGWGV